MTKPTKTQLNALNRAYRKGKSEALYGNAPNESAGKALRKKTAARILELCAENGQDPTANLSEADLKKFLSLTYAEMHVINLITSGVPVRGARDIMRAIEFKADRSIAKAAAPQETQAITVTINSLAEPSVTTTTASAPPKEPLPC